MRSHLGKLAFIEHQNTCRIAQCGETVCDGKGRPIRDELLERILNLLFRLRVERSRRLIEDQNPRIVEQCPGDCPRSPTFVLYAFGSFMMNWCAPDSLAAVITSSGVADGLA